MDNDYVTKAEYTERMAAIGAEDARQNKRIEKLENLMDSINSLTLSVERLAASIETMQREQERQGERLDAIEKEPADNWRAAVKTVITVLLSAAVTYLLTHGGI